MWSLSLSLASSKSHSKRHHFGFWGWVEGMRALTLLVLRGWEILWGGKTGWDILNRLDHWSSENGIFFFFTHVDRWLLTTTNGHPKAFISWSLRTTCSWTLKFCCSKYIIFNYRCFPHYKCKCVSSPISRSLSQMWQYEAAWDLAGGGQEKGRLERWDRVPPKVERGRSRREPKSQPFRSGTMGKSPDLSWLVFPHLFLDPSPSSICPWL